MTAASTARPGPLGRGVYVQITSLSASTALSASFPAGSGTIPGGSTYTDFNVALIQAETQNVRWRDDGTAPTASVGHILAAGETMFYEGDMNNLKFIEVTTSAKLNVTFYVQAAGE